MRTRSTNRSRWTRLAGGAAAATMALALAACGGDDGTTTSSETSASESPSASADSMAMAPFGAACAAVPTTGPGSFSGMSTAPVATAASANPVLSTLVTAVKQAGLVDTLNNASNITVFAPTNDAFTKIPAADLAKVLADKALLTKVLTYHVVGSTITPDQLGAAGPYKTLEGADVPAAGSGKSFTVGTQKANVVCGNVKTANATVYLIDTVLMPPA